MNSKQYFQSSKRGEVNDLRIELNQTNKEKQKEVRFIFSQWLSCPLGRKESYSGYERG